MMTIHAIKKPDVLLVGALDTHCRGPEKLRPYLVVVVPCPYCHDSHTFPWPTEFRPDAAIGPVDVPCCSPEYAGKRVFVCLDPSRRAGFERFAGEYRASLRRWETQKKLEREWIILNDEERVYVRDYPDGMNRA
jgi:hypothetical protein